MIRLSITIAIFCIITSTSYILSSDSDPMIVDWTHTDGPISQHFQDLNNSRLDPAAFLRARTALFQEIDQTNNVADLILFSQRFSQGPPDGPLFAVDRVFREAARRAQQRAERVVRDSFTTNT